MKTKIYFIQNPEGKVFEDSVSNHEHFCKRDFISTWFSGWNIVPDDYQTGVLWKMFEKRGFKLVELKIDLP